LIIVVGVAVFAIWYIRRNRIPKAQFTQLDLISAEDEEELAKEEK